MAARTPINCSIDTTENLTKVLVDEMGELFEQATDLIAESEQLIADEEIEQVLVACNESLQDLLSAGDNGNSAFQYIEELPPLFGIDGPDTQEDDERFIFDNTGCVISSGIFFKKVTGDSQYPDNIETLRRVYNSVGRDLTKVVQEYQSQLDTSYRYHLVTAMAQPDISYKSLTLAEIRTKINDSTIVKSDYIELDDKTVLMVKKSPLLVPDITNAEIPSRFGVNTREVSSTILHKNSAKNTTAIINKWLNQGFNEEVPSILDGEDPSSGVDVIAPFFQQVKSQAGELLSSLNYYKSRFDSINPNSTKAKIDQSLQEIEHSVKELVSIFLSEVSVIREFDTLAKLRLKLSDEQIEHLLLNQRYVTGIDFEVTEDEMLNLFMSTMNQLSGDNGPSTQKLNSQPSLRDQNYQIILYCLADVLKAKEANSVLTSQSLNELILTITTLSSRVLISELPAITPVQGFPCFNTAGSIALKRTDFDGNFGITIKFRALDDAIADLKRLYNEIIGKTLENIFKAIATGAQTAITMVNQLRDKLVAQIEPLKRKLNEFMSKYLTLIGQGNFDSSLFKCAVDYNLGLSTGILDALQILIQSLAEKINQLIALLLNKLLPLIDKLLCKPLAMVDSFIGSANSYMAGFCTMNAPELLTEDTIKYLRDIRSIVAAQSVGFTAFSGNLVKLRAELNTAPDRLDQFKNGASCMGQAASQMMSGSIVNIRAAF